MVMLQVRRIRDSSRAVLRRSNRIRHRGEARSTLTSRGRERRMPIPLGGRGRKRLFLGPGLRGFRGWVVAEGVPTEGGRR